MRQISLPLFIISLFASIFTVYSQVALASIRTVNVVEYGAMGDGVTDDTKAIQKAIDSGASIINYSNKSYLVNGELKLASNQKHRGRNAFFFKRRSNNSFFYGNSVENVVFEGIVLKGNVYNKTNNYKSSAACIRIVNSSNIKLNNISVSYGASGLQIYYSNHIFINNSTFTNNLLTGISGVINDVVIQNSKIINNGFISKGLTHDIYFINSSNGIIKNCQIGDHKDVSSFGLVIRYGFKEEKPNYNSVEKWQISYNTFNKNGVTVGSDPSMKVNKRKPVKNIVIISNDFNWNSDLKVDDPQDCRSNNNKRINNIICRVASLYPSYNIGFTSDNDECISIIQSSLTAIRERTKEKIVFKNTYVYNSEKPAFQNAKGFGGFPACTIITPQIQNRKKSFDNSFEKAKLQRTIIQTF